MAIEVRSENYFIYKGVEYGIGTTVIFTDEVYQYVYNANARYQPHTFVAGSNTGWKGFSWQDDKIPRPKIYCNNISTYNPDKDIKEIVTPVYAQRISWQQQAIKNMADGKVYADVFGGALLYIVIMIVGAIFVDRWLIWIFSTVVFIIWLLNQYRT